MATIDLFTIELLYLDIIGLPIRLTANVITDMSCANNFGVKQQN